MSKSTDQSTIDLIPAPCGIGKSFSMTVQIAEALRKHDGGIILVTDELARMHNYINNSSYLGEYLERNKDRILIYEAANAKADRDKLFKKPILILSTQRFFSLSRESVIELTETYIPKRHVFIDERAPLSETIRIDLGVLNDIDTALNTQLDNTASEKEWLIQQWRNLRSRYDGYMTKYENSHNDYELKLWHTDKDSHATTDDDRFLHCVFNTYAAKLKRADNEILKKIKAVFQIIKEGALFISRRKPNSKSESEYSNFFLATLDNSDLLLNIGSKSIILDGTGDLDPIYNAWYINRINCSQFKRDLSELTINIVDANTSRNAIAKTPGSNPKLKAIVDYAQTIPKVDAIFTYGYGKSDDIDSANTVESVFHKAGFRTGHFGAIKGSNDYRHCTNLVQIGLNRIPDEYYLSTAIHIEANRYPPDKQHFGFKNFEHAAKHVMSMSVLADIEQNLFRGVIRNADNDKHMTYTLIYKAKPQIDKDGVDHNELSELTEMLKARYVEMGATVNVYDTPNAVLQVKTTGRKGKNGKMTSAGKVLSFLCGLPAGAEVTRATILEACDISENAFKDAKKNKHVKEWLQNHRMDNRYIA